MSNKNIPRKKKSGRRKPAKVEGGCLCGLVRYRLRGKPLHIVNCHCVMCRRASGAPFVTWLTVNAADLVFTKMHPVRYASSSRADRSFCDQCGTPLTFQYKSRRKLIDVTVGSLDHPEKFAPRSDIHTSGHVPWVPLDDSLDRHEKDLGA